MSFLYSNLSKIHYSKSCSGNYVKMISGSEISLTSSSFLGVSSNLVSFFSSDCFCRISTFFYSLRKSSTLILCLPQSSAEAKNWVISSWTVQGFLSTLIISLIILSSHTLFDISDWFGDFINDYGLLHFDAKSGKSFIGLVIDCLLEGLSILKSWVILSQTILKVVFELRKDSFF